MIFWLILRGFWFMPSYALWVTPQSSAKLNVLWRYIVVVSFISVAFVVVKLQIFICFCEDEASLKWPLLGGFWVLSPPNMTRLCWNFDQRYVFHKTKTIWTIFQNEVFKRKWNVPKFDGFGPFLDPIYPQKTQNIATNQNFFQKLHPYDYQIAQVLAPT